MLGLLKTSEIGVRRLWNAARKLAWLWALLLALTAAFIFRNGYEEVAAVVWLLSLILVLPMWGQRI